MAETRYTEYADRLAALDAASLCDAAGGAGVRIGVVEPAIHLMSKPGERPLIGPARLVVCDDDFLEVWQGLSASQAGEALLIAAATDRAVVGELFSAEATRRGLAGIIIDGYCRDTARLAHQSLPVYARGATPRAGSTNLARGPVESIVLGGVVVHSGDLVFGDGDGVVIITAGHVATLVPLAEEIQGREAAILETVAAGGAIFDHTNLDEHYQARVAGQPSTLRVHNAPLA